MMPWGFQNMMNWGPGFAWFGFLGLIFWIVVFVDLVLLGIYLWKKIERKK